uniref:Uncharacterized protein n=1 Tax=Morchella importuna TaxID=1174673 RepID=A0A650AFM4_9PEZI|nr:hypothetical protein [Morchella importuna]QGN66701.1 hypothetical protein [Morchella importuna]
MTNRRLCMLGACQVVFNPLLMSINSIITFKFEFSDYIIPGRLLLPPPPFIFYSISVPTGPEGQIVHPPPPPDGAASDPKVTLGRGYYRVEKPYLPPPPTTELLGVHLYSDLVTSTSSGYRDIFYFRSKAAAKPKKLPACPPPPLASLTWSRQGGRGVGEVLPLASVCS